MEFMTYFDTWLFWIRFVANFRVQFKAQHKLELTFCDFISKLGVYCYYYTWVVRCMYGFLCIGRVCVAIFKAWKYLHRLLEVRICFNQLLLPSNGIPELIYNFKPKIWLCMYGFLCLRKVNMAIYRAWKYFYRLFEIRVCFNQLLLPVCNKVKALQSLYTIINQKYI